MPQPTWDLNPVVRRTAEELLKEMRPEARGFTEILFDDTLVKQLVLKMMTWDGAQLGAIANEGRGFGEPFQAYREDIPINWLDVRNVGPRENLCRLAVIVMHAAMCYILETSEQ